MFISTTDVNNFLRSQKFDVARDSTILFIIETQLSSSVLSPTKHSSGQGERKAVISTSGYLCQRNSRQRLQRMREQLTGLSFTQSKLATGVLAPREQLAISRKCDAVLIPTHYLRDAVVTQPFHQPWDSNSRLCSPQTELAPFTSSPGKHLALLIHRHRVGPTT